MSSNLTPYLSFRDQAMSAMEFYRSVFGGELSRLSFGENGVGEPAEADRTMHSQLEIATGLTLMAADVPDSLGAPTPNGSIALSGGPAEADELRSWYTGLSEGASEALPLEQAPWGDSFGMCVDRFGVRWMVNISGR